MDIFCLKRTWAYCMRMLRVVYLRIPTRKTGIVNRTFLFDATLRIRFNVEKTMDSSGRGSNPSPSIPDSESGFGDFPFGITESTAKHERTETNDKVQGIQGEISVVTVAINDATISAI